MTGLQETKLLCEKNGVLSNDIQIFSCDVSSKNSILQGAVKARRAYGPVTILINNAGVVSGLNILELSDSMIDKTLKINTIYISSYLFSSFQC